MVENKVVFNVSPSEDEYKIKSVMISGTSDLKIKIIEKKEKNYAILTNRNFTYISEKNWNLNIEICFDEGLVKSIYQIFFKTFCLFNFLILKLFYT